MIERWRAWIAAFDKATETSEWEPLESFLDPEVTYNVSGVPFACSIVGSHAVLAGFAKSISNFDQKFDTREWYGVGVHEFAPDTITGRAMGLYRLGDKPPLHFSAKSVWRFKGDRLIAMHDMYDVAEADVQSAFAWLAEHAPELDASYE